MKDFGKRLREIRKQCDLTQEELAERILVNHQSISNWELDKAVPDIIQLQLLCKALACSADSLLNLPIENSPTQTETGSGLKWRIMNLSGINSSRAREIDDAIEIFRLIAKDEMGFRDIQRRPKFAGFSEAKLRQLLKVALFSSVIQLTDVDRDRVKEEELLNQFRPQLRQCIVAKTSLSADQFIDSTIRTEAISFLAARDAIASIPNNAYVGLTGGHTIARFVDLLPPASPDLRGIRWLPLLVTQDHDRMVRTTLSANSVITRLLYKQPGAEGFRLPFLDLPRRNSKYLKKVSGHEELYVKAAQDVRMLGREASVVFLSVGTPEYKWQITDAHMGLPSLMDVFDTLSPAEQKECVGDILLTLVDKQGKRLGSDESKLQNDKLVYSIELDYLREIARFGTVWVLAGRSQPGKANVIRAGLHAELINSLVIDSTVADTLLEIAS